MKNDNATVRDAMLGRATGEGIVKVSVRLEWNERKDGYVTVDHELISGYWSFSVVGAAWKRVNSPDCYAAGQIIDIASLVNSPLAARLIKLWREWHLNDMQAGCTHQVEPTTINGRIDLDSVQPCELSGYKYGHAWLVRVIPDDVLAEMRAVIAELKDL